jgi:predicted CXXCH cytochrome family protein
MSEFEIQYTFGIYPLQQYLIEFPGGRYQVLTLCWDNRPKEEGGQRWFHLHQNDPTTITPKDPLHWTRPNFNWNYMCAECHSTNLKKNYDSKTDTYQTTWSNIDVGCQACHGPGSNHVEWAHSIKNSGATWDKDDKKGLEVQLDTADSRIQVEACARCHSRRLEVSNNYKYGQRFMDHYLPRVLLETLYHPDGQILDEVYVYGSFIQSKKYQEGVRCTDCHNPHTATLLAPDNTLCVRCHNTLSSPQFKTIKDKDYDTPVHHFHKPGSPGSKCIDCHMPERNYMVVDPRSDHRFGVPRPDLTVKLGVPNACNQCHTDKTAPWAVDWIDKWYPKTRKQREETHFAEIINAGRTHRPEAQEQLAQLAQNKIMPAIIRATALRLLYQYNNQKTLDVMVESLRDDEPIIRTTAVGSFSIFLPPSVDTQWQRRKLMWLAPLLKDPIRTVRVEAARVLVEVQLGLFNTQQLEDFQKALEEYKQRNEALADRSETHLNIGVMHENLGDLELAEESYKKGIELDDNNIYVRFNLVSLYNKQGRNREAEQQLRQIIELSPKNGEAYYSLGLLLAELKRLNEAADSLAKAAELLPNRTRVRYNYALALQHLGRTAEAEMVMLEVHQIDPRDPAIVRAMAVFYIQQSQWDSALHYAQKLIEMMPGAPGPRKLMQEIQKQLLFGSTSE